MSCRNKEHAMRYASFIAILLLPALAGAQALDKENAQTMTLKGGVRVKLYASMEDRSRYYYVPLTLQLAQGKGKSPEISLMLYRNKESKVSGGILHALLTWGLTPLQEGEIRTMLQRKDSLAEFGGAAEIALKTGELECNDTDVFANALLAVSQMPVKLPREPIHKTAASFSLSPALAEELHRQLTAGASKSSGFFGKFRYTVHRRTKTGTFGEEVTAEMVLPVSTLLKALKDYRLIKYINL
jgi:hypothetical protein